ncbi:MAG: DUF2087 domain-containing protein [Fimbriimonadales bacterium]
MEEELPSTYLDAEGRLHTWPSKRNKARLQEIALRWLAQAFESGRDYSEAEVNKILNERHTFGDAALLRREMFERGILLRTRDCRRYWKPD